MFCSICSNLATQNEKYYMEDFIHLHVHTNYSILDGQSKIPKLVDKAIKDGDITALKYMLNTHGKSRGYGQKQELSEDVTEIIVDIVGE